MIYEATDYLGCLSAIPAVSRSDCSVARRCLAMISHTFMTGFTCSHFAGQKSQLMGSAVTAAASPALHIRCVDGAVSTYALYRRVAARARHCLILLPLHDGDETYDSWKPLLNTSQVLLRLIAMFRAIKQNRLPAGAAFLENMCEQTL